MRKNKDIERSSDAIRTKFALSERPPLQAREDHVQLVEVAEAQRHLPAKAFHRDFHAQPGDFYGGWVTANLTGRIKGGPGTRDWSRGQSSGALEDLAGKRVVVRFPATRVFLYDFCAVVAEKQILVVEEVRSSPVYMTKRKALVSSFSESTSP
jgi:hypothetical protein